LATLLIENGPDKGKGQELKPGVTYTLGRDPTCDIVLQGELVSRKHVLLKEFKGAFYVKDLDSLNGTFLNDQPITQAELKPGDKLQLGDAVMTFVDESLAKAKEEKILGGYRLLERVGRGGMGTVYRAIQISLDREVALKILSPDLVKDKTFVEQFFREARAAGQLNHPHIVQVYDVGQEGETFYYSMEFVRAGSLEDRLRKEGTLDVEEALRIAFESAQALEYAEMRGIVHRDIKPDNLMLAEDGRVRVADLGLAFSMKSSADTKGQPILGTPHFISPEQALRRDIDIRSDIYSLGATLYRMLAGKTVFSGASAEEIIRKAVREEPAPLREQNAAVPEKVAALVHRMLRKNPDERFPSAKELRVAIEHLRRRPVRTRALVAAITVAVAAVVFAIVIVLKKPPPAPAPVDSGDLQALKAKSFEMASEVDKRRIELEAVRRYLKVWEPRDGAAPDAAALRGGLAGWLAEYDYLAIEERDRARGVVKRLDDDVARAAAEKAERDRLHQQRLAAFRAAVDAHLQKADFLAAMAAAGAIAPSTDDDEAARADIVAERDVQLAAVRAKAEAEQLRVAQAVDAAMAGGDLEQALLLCQQATAAWQPTEGLALPEDLRALVVGWSGGFEQRRAALSSQADASTRAVEARDRERKVRALAAPTRQAALALDFGGAAAAIDAVITEVESAGAKARLQPWSEALTQGQKLVDRLLTELDGGGVTPEPSIKVGAMERSAELVGVDREKRLFKLRATVGRGSSSTTVPFASLASAEGLRQLFVGRIALTAEERVDLAKLMTVVDVLRWAEELAPLADRAAKYDARLGWSDELRQGLAEPAAAALADAVDVALKEVPVEQADVASQLRTRARSEQLAHQELVAALDPFFRRDSTLGWTASVEALRRLLGERSDTLLLQVVRPWIEGT
jgi:serine/threonine protein kinase